jgi:hypothetical protein
MIAGQVVLSYVSVAHNGNGVSCSVDLSSCHCTVSPRFNNPIAWIPTPSQSGQLTGTNQIGFNLGFYVYAFDLSFTIAESTSPSNPIIPTTVNGSSISSTQTLSPGKFDFEPAYIAAGACSAYEVLMYMATDGVVGKQPKYLTLNGYTPTCNVTGCYYNGSNWPGIPVQIIQIRCPWAPGQPNISQNCTISLQAGADLGM